jgi:ABC-type transport system involved in multi-copper enzyme maturation permease subunit
MPPILRWLFRLAPANPIAVRLVQSGSRRTRHLYIRAGYLAALILVLLWLLLPSSGGALSYRALAQAGATAFEYAAYLQIGLICVLAPVFMAGAIAQEASPRTWEVLLTTPLSPGQIVLGNLLGRLFFILALLFSSLPLFALTQYFGGVPSSSIFASYAIAATAALLVGAIAIALSVSRLAGGRAVFAFYVAVVSYIVITIAIDLFLRRSGYGAGTGSGVTVLTSLNPFLALEALLNPSGYPRAVGTAGTVRRWLLEHPVTTWCVGSSVLSVFLMVVSAITVRAGGLATFVAGGGGGVPWYRRMLGLSAAGSEHRAPRAVGTNPIAWREATARNSTLGRMLVRYAFIAIGLVWGVAMVVLLHRKVLSASEFQLALMATVIGELAVTTLVAINMASTAVSREREDGTLDLLLTTPMTPGQYLTGKLKGLVAYVLPMIAVPVGTLLIAGLYVVSGGFGMASEAGVATTLTTAVATRTQPIEVPLLLPETGLLAALVFVPFIAFVVMVGLHWSLKSKGNLGAVITTVGIVAAIAGVVGLCAWNSAVSVPLVGPVLGAMSPASVVYASVHPADAMTETVAREAGLQGARAGLAIGAVLAAAIYLGIVYGIHANMVRTFDMTVRKLAGVR